MYRTPLLIGLFIGVLTAFMWGGNIHRLAEAGDQPSSSEQSIIENDGEPESIILRLRQKLQQKEFLELNAILADYQTRFRIGCLRRRPSVYGI
jgi:hypothetical protein